jgi:hypothetical protein
VSAGYHLLSGSYNACIGANTGHTDGATPTADVSNAPLLGYQAQTTTSNVIVLGSAVKARRTNMIFGAVSAAAAFGGGIGVFAIAPAAINPSNAPVGAGLLYVDAQTKALIYPGPQGTTTVIAPA